MGSLEQEELTVPTTEPHHSETKIAGDEGISLSEELQLVGKMVEVDKIAMTDTADLSPIKAHKEKITETLSDDPSEPVVEVTLIRFDDIDRKSAIAASKAVVQSVTPQVKAAVPTTGTSGINLRAENVEPFVPKSAVTHRRRDSISGEIPMQQQQLQEQSNRNEARVHQMFAYSRNDHQYQQQQQQHNEPFYNRQHYRGHRDHVDRSAHDHEIQQGDYETQEEDAKGTVYASDDSYSFRWADYHR